MNTVYDFKEDRDLTVYVRPVATATLPRDIRDKLPSVTTMYAVHDTDGERLALVQDRTLAFTLARQNDMVPVSVH